MDAQTESELFWQAGGLEWEQDKAREAESDFSDAERQMISDFGSKYKNIISLSEKPSPAKEQDDVFFQFTKALQSPTDSVKDDIKAIISALEEFEKEPSNGKLLDLMTAVQKIRLNLIPEQSKSIRVQGLMQTFDEMQREMESMKNLDKFKINPLDI